jgi:hypothetical protein
MAAIAQTRAIPFNPPFPVAQQSPVQVLADDGAITIPGGYVILTKAGASAITLAAPTVDGLELTVYSLTAQAHTLTVSGGLYGVGATKDVGTFGGAIEDTVTLFSRNGAWHKKYALNVTFG